MKKDIPTGWQQVSLFEVAEIRSGLAKGKKNIANPITLPYLRVANVQDGYLDLREIKEITLNQNEIQRYLLHDEDVLLTEGGDFDKLGRGALWKSQILNCLHQNHIFAVRVKKEKLLPKFLSYQTASLYGKKYFLRCSKQSTNLASINSSQLKQFPVLLPSLSEQQKIVEILSTWDEGIEKLERLFSKKKDLFSDVSSNLLNDLSKKFQSLGKVTREISTRNSNKRIQQILSVTNDRGFIAPEDQFSRRVASINLSNYKVVKKGQFAYNPSRINVGSISRLDTYEEGVISPMYTVFELVPEKLNSDFFLYWLSTYSTKERIKKSAQGGVRETVGFKDLGGIPIYLPSIDKQLLIVSKLSTIRYEINLVQNLLTQYKIQKKSLLQVLLTGTRRVK